MTARGIRSSYNLRFPRGAHLGSNDPSGSRVVTEIPRPAWVVVDGETGVLRCVWRTE